MVPVILWWENVFVQGKCEPSDTREGTERTCAVCWVSQSLKSIVIHESNNPQLISHLISCMRTYWNILMMLGSMKCGLLLGLIVYENSPVPNFSLNLPQQRYHFLFLEGCDQKCQSGFFELVSCNHTHQAVCKSKFTHEIFLCGSDILVLKLKLIHCLGELIRYFPLYW